MEPAVDLTMAESSESDDGDEHVCSICCRGVGRVLPCTGQCLRSYHIPDPAEGDGDCHVLGLDVVEGDVLWRHRGAFVCPLCWRWDEDSCSNCKKKEREMLTCNVGGCENRFCKKCREDPKMAASFGAGFFICSHHFCTACKSLEGQSECNPLIPCLLCPTAIHLQCKQRRIHTTHNERIYLRDEHANDAHVLFAKDVMICEEHQTTIDSYWKETLALWKEKWFPNIEENTSRELIPWMHPAACSLPEGEVRDGNSVMLEDVNLESVLRSLPESEQEVLSLFTDAAAESLKHRETEPRHGFFPYDTEPNIIPQRVLDEFERTIQFAQQKERLSNQLITKQYLAKFKRYRECLRCYLCPLHHRGKYTSFGRHFTKPLIMRTVADILVPLMKERDMLVDMTCGLNTFVPLVKKLCAERGVQIVGRSYDIITPYVLEDWVRRSWFDVHQDELYIGDRLVIGLNPPFGKNGRLAGVFLAKAVEFQPRYIALIAPPHTAVPPSYELVYQDQQLCDCEAFSTPTGRRSKNNEVPSLRLLRRRDPPFPLERSFPHSQTATRLARPVSRTWSERSTVPSDSSVHRQRQDFKGCTRWIDEPAELGTMEFHANAVDMERRAFQETGVPRPFGLQPNCNHDLMPGCNSNDAGNFCTSYVNRANGSGTQNRRLRRRKLNDKGRSRRLMNRAQRYHPEVLNKAIADRSFAAPPAQAQAFHPFAAKEQEFESQDVWTPRIRPRPTMPFNDSFNRQTHHNASWNSSEHSLQGSEPIPYNLNSIPPPPPPPMDSRLRPRPTLFPNERRTSSEHYTYVLEEAGASEVEMPQCMCDTGHEDKDFTCPPQPAFEQWTERERCTRRPFPITRSQTVHQFDRMRSQVSQRAAFSKAMEGQQLQIPESTYRHLSHSATPVLFETRRARAVDQQTQRQTNTSRRLESNQAMLIPRQDTLRNPYEATNRMEVCLAESPARRNLQSMVRQFDPFEQRPIQLHLGPVQHNINIHIHPRPNRKRRIQALTSLLQNVEDFIEDETIDDHPDPTFL